MGIVRSVSQVYDDDPKPFMIEPSQIQIVFNSKMSIDNRYLMFFLLLEFVESALQKQLV